MQVQPQLQTIDNGRDLGAEAKSSIRLAMLKLGGDDLQPLPIGAMLFDQLFKLGNRILEMWSRLAHAANRPSASLRA